MPLAIVSRDPEVITERMAAKIGPFLQYAIAVALDVQEDPAAHLKPKDIEVWWRDNRPIDINTLPFGVSIFASEFPGRRANLDNRVKIIAEMIKTQAMKDPDMFLPASALTGEKSFVWVILGPAAFIYL